MPNGVMTGDGSRGNPWVVEDGWDFNALRNLPHTSSATVGFVELGADINLAMFPAFAPIEGRWFNIEGNGHMILDVSVNGAGLFVSLNTTEYVRNMVIEGEVIAIGLAQVGLLAGSIVGNTTGAIVENIEGYGSIITTMSAATSRCAGLIGIIQGSMPGSGAAAGIFTIARCSFKGTINANVTNASTGASGIVGVGGVVNFHNSSPFGGATPIIRCIQCISDVTVVVTGATGTTTTFIGGVVGTTGNNQGNTGHTNEIISCIGRLRVRYENQATSSRIWRIGSILGLSNGSNTTRIMRCAGFIKISYNPLIALGGTITIGGLMGSGTNTQPVITQCYAVIELENINNTNSK